jgi:hypothetical protein
LTGSRQPGTDQPGTLRVGEEVLHDPRLGRRHTEAVLTLAQDHDQVDAQALTLIDL